MNKKERETREFETDFQKSVFLGGGVLIWVMLTNFLEARSEKRYVDFRGHATVAHKCTPNSRKSHRIQITHTEFK